MKSKKKVDKLEKLEHDTDQRISAVQRELNKLYNMFYSVIYFSIALITGIFGNKMLHYVEIWRSSYAGKCALCLCFGEVASIIIGVLCCVMVALSVLVMICMAITFIGEIN